MWHAKDGLQGEEKWGPADLEPRQEEGPHGGDEG